MPDESPKKTPPPKPTRSGEHPAVQKMRAKMESISDEEGMTAHALLDLDAKLESFLEEARSVHPPPATQTPCEVNPVLSCVCSRGTKSCDVAHEMEDTKATKRLAPLVQCEHGTLVSVCNVCTPRA